MSERAEFVDICTDHGIEFIGPKSSQINLMGDKNSARETMKVRGRFLACVSFKSFYLYVCVC